MRRVFFLVVVAAASLAGSACFNFNNSTSPTSISSVLGGTWTTVQSLPGTSGSLQDACVNYSWNVTQFNGTRLRDFQRDERHLMIVVHRLDALVFAEFAESGHKNPDTLVDLRGGQSNS